MEAIMIPNVHFGDVKENKTDWRKENDNTPDSDEELDQTPEDIVDLLGFDPKEIG